MSGIEKLFSSQRAITILVISVVFAIVFPAYFSFMATTSDATGGGSPGAKGKWQVDFIMLSGQALPTSKKKAGSSP